MSDRPTVHHNIGRTVNAIKTSYNRVVPVVTDGVETISGFGGTTGNNNSYNNNRNGNSNTFSPMSMVIPGVVPVGVVTEIGSKVVNRSNLNNVYNREGLIRGNSSKMNMVEGGGAGNNGISHTQHGLYPFGNPGPVNPTAPPYEDLSYTFDPNNINKNNNNSNNKYNNNNNINNGNRYNNSYNASDDNENSATDNNNISNDGANPYNNVGNHNFNGNVNTSADNPNTNNSLKINKNLDENNDKHKDNTSHAVIDRQPNPTNYNNYNNGETFNYATKNCRCRCCELHGRNGFHRGGSKKSDGWSGPGEDSDTEKLTEEQVFPENLREWSSGLCGCFQDCRGCAYCLFCQSCFLCELSFRLNEFHLGSQVCGQTFLVALRTKTRMKHGIKGTIMKDICAMLFCTSCAVHQMYRELNHVAQKNL